MSNDLTQGDSLNILNSIVVKDGAQWRFDFSGTVVGERGRFKSILDLLNAVIISVRMSEGDRSSQMKGVVQSSGGPVRDLRADGFSSGNIVIAQDGQVTETWLKVSDATGALEIQIDKSKAKVGDVVHLFVQQGDATPVTPTFTDVNATSVSNINPTFGTQGDNWITQLTFVCKADGEEWILTSFAEIYWE